MPPGGKNAELYPNPKKNGVRGINIQSSFVGLDSLPWNMGPIGCPETSVKNYYFAVKALKSSTVSLSLIFNGYYTILCMGKWCVCVWCIELLACSVTWSVRPTSIYVRLCGPKSISWQENNVIMIRRSRHDFHEGTTLKLGKKIVPT
jgi:hypothetical protein